MLCERQGSKEAACTTYNVFMLDELDFRRKVDAAIEDLKRSLMPTSKSRSNTVR